MKKPTPVVWGTTAVHTIQCQVGVQSATVAQQPIPIGKSEEIVAVRHRVVLQFVAIAAAAEEEVQGIVQQDNIRKLRCGDGMIIPPLAVKDAQQDKENHTDAIGRIIAMVIHVLLEIAMII